MRLLAFLGVLAFLQTPAPKAEFPPIVTAKTLYADHDFRGKAAPKLEFGTWITAKPADLKGKTILVDFWATWCPPCRELIPELSQWQAKFKDDLVVIGISDEVPDKITGFMKTTPMAYSVATDQAGKTAKKIGVKGIPHVIVISPDGIVRWQGFPPMEEDPLTTDKLGQIIAAGKALKPEAPKAPATPPATPPANPPAKP